MSGFTVCRFDSLFPPSKFQRGFHEELLPLDGLIFSFSVAARERSPAIFLSLNRGALFGPELVVVVVEADGVILSVCEDEEDGVKKRSDRRYKEFLIARFCAVRFGCCCCCTGADTSSAVVSNVGRGEEVVASMEGVGWSELFGESTAELSERRTELSEFCRSSCADGALVWLSLSMTVAGVDWVDGGGVVVGGGGERRTEERSDMLEFSDNSPTSSLVARERSMSHVPVSFVSVSSVGVCIFSVVIAT